MTLLAFGILIVGAYALMLLFSPTARKQEIEDLKRTGCAWHAFAWVLALLIGGGFVVAAALLVDVITP